MSDEFSLEIQSTYPIQFKLSNHIHNSGDAKPLWHYGNPKGYYFILVNVRNRRMFKVILVINVDEEGQQPLLNLGRGSNPFTHDKSTCH